MISSVLKAQFDQIFTEVSYSDVYLLSQTWNVIESGYLVDVCQQHRLGLLVRVELGQSLVANLVKEYGHLYNIIILFMVQTCLLNWELNIENENFIVVIVINLLDLLRVLNKVRKSCSLYQVKIVYEHSLGYFRHCSLPKEVCWLGYFFQSVSEGSNLECVFVRGDEAHEVAIFTVGDRGHQTACLV